MSIARPDPSRLDEQTSTVAVPAVDPPGVAAATSVLAGSEGAAGQSLLARVAVALNSTVDLREVLLRLAEMALATTGADRASLFLLRGRCLEAQVAIGRRADDALWDRFRTMEPVVLDDIQWSRLRAGRALFLPDVRQSPLVPEAWTGLFSLQSLVLVPLLSVREPCGLLALDWQDSVASGEVDLGLLETIGSCAGVAVRNAHLYGQVERRARLSAGLAAGSAALNEATDPTEVAEVLVGVFGDLFEVPTIVVGLLDADRARLQVVASKGTRHLKGPLSVEEVPRAFVRRLWKEWSAGKWPVNLGRDAELDAFLGLSDGEPRDYVILPLVVCGHSRGVVLLGRSNRRQLGEEDVSAAETLASAGAAALDRLTLLEDLHRQLKRLDALYQSSASLVEGAGTPRLIAGLNVLLASHGIEVEGIVWRDRGIRRVLGGPTPGGQRSRGVHPNGNERSTPADSLVVPMRLGTRVVGTMQVRADGLEAEDRSLVEALGRGLADVANRHAQRAAVERSDQDRAVAHERDRLASELHDTAGQLFVAIGLLARRHIEQLPSDSRWGEMLSRLANLADQGKWEIDRTLRALAFVPEGRRSLVASLKALARSVQADSGIEVDVSFHGPDRRIGPKAEQAFYRVAQEAITNAWRHARCGVIRIELRAAGEGVLLRVVDDGVGLGARHRAPGGVHTGIAGMRRAMGDVGGTLRVANGHPRGVTVEARVAGRRR